MSPRVLWIWACLDWLRVFLAIVCVYLRRVRDSLILLWYRGSQNSFPLIRDVQCLRMIAENERTSRNHARDARVQEVIVWLTNFVLTLLSIRNKYLNVARIVNNSDAMKIDGRFLFQ